MKLATVVFPLCPQGTSDLRRATRCQNWYVTGRTFGAMLTSLPLQGRIGQDTLSAMIRQDETATRSSRRRFYDVYTSQGDLLGKLRYPAGELASFSSPRALFLIARNVRGRSYTGWQLDQGPIRRSQRNHRSIHGPRRLERELPDLELLL